MTPFELYREATRLYNVMADIACYDKDKARRDHAARLLGKLFRRAARRAYAIKIHSRWSTRSVRTWPRTSFSWDTPSR